MGRVRHRPLCWALVALSVASSACSNKDPAAAKTIAASAEPSTALGAPSGSSSAAAASNHPTTGDPERGRALIAQFECNRCHDGTGTETPKFEKQCFHCHEKIL